MSKPLGDVVAELEADINDINAARASAGFPPREDMLVKTGVIERLCAAFRQAEVMRAERTNSYETDVWGLPESAKKWDALVK